MGKENKMLKIKAEKIAQQIRKKINTLVNCDKIDAAIILGSGLSGLVDKIENQIILPYDELKGMPKSTVQGHKNQFIFGQINNKNVLAMQGRFHMYDGFSAKEATMPIAIFKLLQIKTLIVTNAAGGVNPTYNAGDIMIINDYLNMTGRNPCDGGNILGEGPQFCDMTEPFNLEYINTVKSIANKHSIELREGVYAQNLGPQYETKADVKHLQKIGADAVGMSTVVEVMLARQFDINVLGFSCISNKGTGLSNEKLTHQEVLDNAKNMGDKLLIIIQEFIKTL